jgi:hypothetical protein
MSDDIVQALEVQEVATAAVLAMYILKAFDKV